MKRKSDRISSLGKRKKEKRRETNVRFRFTVSQIINARNAPEGKRLALVRATKGGEDGGGGGGGRGGSAWKSRVGNTRLQFNCYVAPSELDSNFFNSFVKLYSP